MKKFFHAPSAITALFVAIAICASSPASAQSTNIKIAVANPARIFQEIREFQDLKAAMQAEQKQLENQEKEKRAQLKELQAARDMLKPDSPQYQERSRDLLQKTIEFETWGRVQQMTVQAEQKRQMLGLFMKIGNAVSEVAAAKGIDLVISEQKPDFSQVNLDQLNVEQLRALINSQNVLFKSQAADISDDVIKAMDDKYKSSK